MPETAFLRRYVVTGRLQSIFDRQGIEVAIELLEKDEFFARTGLDAMNLLDCALSRGGLLDAASYRELIASKSSRWGWAVDKDPRLIEYLPLVKVLFPGAHVINIIRDPRDVLASRKAAAWSKGGHVWKHIFANRVQLALGRKIGPQLFGYSYHEVVYEELITAPHNVLTKVCNEVGLPYAEQMLSFGKAARQLVSEEEMSWKKETLGPLLQDNKGKWKTALSAREILLAEACCQEAISVGGYTLDDRSYRLSLSTRLWIGMGAQLVKWAAVPYMFYRTQKVAAVCKRQM